VAVGVLVEVGKKHYQVKVTIGLPFAGGVLSTGPDASIELPTTLATCTPL
jgi:hypothetical protein